MAKLTFFSVLKSNLKCAFCKKENCPVRYMPQRKKTQIYEGTRYVTRCEKDQKTHEHAILKKRLPWKVSQQTSRMYHLLKVVHFVFIFFRNLLKVILIYKKYYILQ